MTGSVLGAGSTWGQEGGREAGAGGWRSPGEARTGSPELLGWRPLLCSWWSVVDTPWNGGASSPPGPVAVGVQPAHCAGTRVFTEAFPGPGVVTLIVRVFVVLGSVWGPPVIDGSRAPSDGHSS